MNNIHIVVVSFMVIFNFNYFSLGFPLPSDTNNDNIKLTVILNDLRDIYNLHSQQSGTFHYDHTSVEMNAEYLHKILPGLEKLTLNEMVPVIGARPWESRNLVRSLLGVLNDTDQKELVLRVIYRFIQSFYIASEAEDTPSSLLMASQLIVDIYHKDKTYLGDNIQGEINWELLVFEIIEKAKEIKGNYAETTEPQSIIILDKMINQSIMKLEDIMKSVRWPPRE